MEVPGVRKAGKIQPLPEAVASLVQDGSFVALEGFTHLIPFAAGHELLRQGRQDLTLVRLTPDVLFDQMIGLGRVERVVFSYGGNPGVGSLHRFRDAIENGWARSIAPRGRGRSCCPPGCSTRSATSPTARGRRTRPTSRYATTTSTRNGTGSRATATASASGWTTTSSTPRRRSARRWSRDDGARSDARGGHDDRRGARARRRRGRPGRGRAAERRRQPRAPARPPGLRADLRVGRDRR